EVLFGVRGVPKDTIQVVFFSDDEELIELVDDGGKESTLGEQLCAVARSRPSRDGSIWCDPTESWDVQGDFRLFALGVTSDGRRWTASDSLCNALVTWHSNSDRKSVPKADITEAIELLQRFGEP